VHFLAEYLFFATKAFTLLDKLFHIHPVI